MNKTYIYARVSTEEQAEKGKSIETQIRLAQNWAKNNNATVIGEFIDEGKSATTLSRPALQDMLSKCQKGEVDAILVMDTDRLARNTLDHLTLKSILKKKDIKVISISQPMIDDSPEGNLIDTIIASVNAFQSQITGRKTSKVLEEKAKMGWFPGGLPMLGYRNIENSSPSSTLDKKIITADLDISPYIIEIFNMYVTGNYNVKEIAFYLNKKGIKSPFGNKIHPSYVVLMLKNEFYIGKFRWKNILYQGKHKPIITEEVYNRVQMVMQSHNQNTTRKRKHQFLLRGFIFCDLCGSRMWAEKHTKKNGNIYELYYCSDCKKNTYVNKDKLEDQVKLIFKQIQLSPNYVNQVITKAHVLLQDYRSNTESEKKRLNIEIHKIERALKEAEDNRFIQHSLTEDAFNRIYPRYEQQLKDLKKALEEIDQDHSQKIKTLEKILALAENIGQAYNDATYIFKRNYLTLFFKDFKVKNGKITKYNLSEDLKPLIKEGSVRVSKSGLPDVDSNHEP